MVVLGMLGLGKLDGEGLRGSLVVATFRVQSESSHLILDFPKDLVGSGRSLRANI